MPVRDVQRRTHAQGIVRLSRSRVFLGRRSADVQTQAHRAHRERRRQLRDQHRLQRRPLDRHLQLRSSPPDLPLRRLRPRISFIESHSPTPPAAVILSETKDLRRKHRIIPQNEYRVKTATPAAAAVARELELMKCCGYSQQLQPRCLHGLQPRNATLCAAVLAL